MANPSNSAVQNLLPVQAYFDAQNNFVTFIGQGQPFYASVYPYQSGLHITNSTIDSTTIGATTPSTGAFTSFSTTTGTIATQPTAPTDIVNLLALQSYAAGISWKQPCAVATLTNITLSGLQTIDTYTTLEGDRVLVKDQGTAANNGIYIASAGAWTRALDANSWDELICAISFIEYGTQKGGAWFCTAQPGGTLGVTAVNWSQFTTSATYTAGTGLTLTGFEFKITNTGVPASTYGSATATPVFAVNAQGQITSVTNTTITPAIGNVTGLGTGIATFLATPTSANLAAAVSDETGSGALVFAQSPTLITPALGTPASGVMTNVTGLPLTTGVTGTLPIGNGGTGQITASAAFNALSPITSVGDLIIGTGVNTASRLGIGTNGQVLTSNGTTASWQTVAANVSSFSAGTTGFTPSTSTTGAVTLAGTLATTNGGTGLTAFTANGIVYASSTSALATGSVLKFDGTNFTSGKHWITVNGTTTSQYLNFGDGTTTFASLGGYYDSATAGHLEFYTATGGTSTERMRITSAGDVGIGTTAPTSKFEAYNSSSTVFTTISINNPDVSGYGSKLSFKQGATEYGSITSAYSAGWNLSFGTNASERMRITGNGGISFGSSGTAYGTSGQLLQSNGDAAPTWLSQSSITAGTATNAVNTGITDDTTTASAVYPTWVTTTTGNLPQKTSSTKLSFVPSTGVLSATTFSGAHSGSGAGLTSIPNSALTNSSVTVTAGTGMSGGGAVALGSSVTLTNAGVTSVTAGTGISVSASTGGVTITNTSSNTFGLAGSWTDVSGSRSLGTNYTNSTGRAIAVNIFQNGSGTCGMAATVNGVQFTFCVGPGYAGGGFIVQNGATYSVNYAFDGGAITWSELR